MMMQNAFAQRMGMRPIGQPIVPPQQRMPLPGPGQMPMPMPQPVMAGQFNAQGPMQQPMQAPQMNGQPMQQPMMAQNNLRRMAGMQ